MKPVALALALVPLAASATALAQQPNPWAPPPTQPSQPAPAPNGPSSTELKLREAEQRDSGRGLEKLWVAPEVGLLSASFGDFGGGSVSKSGLQVGTGLGVRALFFTLGVRGRLAFLDDAKLFSVGPEAGFHVPLGNLEPYALAGLGYSSLGGLPGDLSVKGFHARLGGGLDYYVTPHFSVGGLATFEILRLTAKAPVGESKSSTGTGLSASLVVGLHL